MELPSDFYRTAVQRLLEKMGPHHARYLDAVLLQSRLLENLTYTERYGNSENLRSDRAVIIEQCIRLSLEVTGMSLLQLMSEGMPPGPTPHEAAETYVHRATGLSTKGNLGEALQLLRKAKQLDPDFPGIDAKISALERESRRPYTGLDGLINVRQLFTWRGRHPGDVIAANVEQGAQGVAVGKNIVQIGTLVIPVWSLIVLIILIALLIAFAIYYVYG